MGGLLILTAVIVPTLLWAKLSNPYIWIVILATIGFGAIGFADDYLKITRHSHHGLFARYKFASQTLVAVLVGLSLIWLSNQEPQLYHTPAVPVLQGLGAGPRLVVRAVCRVCPGGGDEHGEPDRRPGRSGDQHVRGLGGHVHRAGIHHRPCPFADYLDLLHFEPTGELTVFGGAMVGASLGFLWWNAHPADIFMGDVGSLGLGGALGTVALLTKQELLLPIVGGVFVLEGLSVILQVGSFKLRGKRIFRMAPLHHHFELIGWAEPKVITRFLILAIVFALFSLTTLKLR